MIYLDHHATTPLDPRVRDAMWPYYGERFGNASNTIHSPGKAAREAIELAREKIARLLNAPSNGIYFTSGATEANNWALKGILRPGSGLVTTAVEHASILDPAHRLKREGIELRILDVDREGCVDLDRFRDALTPATRLASVIWGQNELGSINPISEIGKICQERGILLHVDASQLVGKLPIDLEKEPVDLLSCTAHKIYGPQGIGLLFVRPDREIRIRPLLEGGGQERKLRSGTLPVALCVGFGEACDLARQELASESQRILDLRDLLWNLLKANLTGIIRNGPSEGTLPGNLSVSFEGIEGTALLTSLEQVVVSSGSACSSANQEPSHVLRAIGVPESLARATLRFGLGRFTTQTEVEQAAKEVCQTVLKLR